MWELFEQAYNSLSSLPIESVDTKYKHLIKMAKSKTFVVHNFPQKDDATLDLLLKFLTKKLGLRGHIESKQIVLNKQLSTTSLTILLEQFYNEFIRCKFCFNDNTKITGNNIVCTACGQSYDSRD